MKSLAIVEDLHVFEYLRPGLLLASVDIAPNQLCSQGLEECFRARVVPAVAPAAHALNETVARGNLLKLTACVLNSSIGMKHQSPWRTATNHGHGHRGQHQLGVHEATQRPAHNPTGVQVQYGTQIHPPFGGGNVGNVRYPHAVCRGDFEVPVQQIFGHFLAFFRACGEHKSPLRTRPQRVLSHDSSNSLLPHMPPAPLQFFPHARTAVSMTHLALDHLDLLDQFLLLNGSCALAALDPGIVPTACNAQYLCHLLNAVGSPLFAFLKMSRSSRNSFTSLRKAANSSSRDLPLP